MYDYYNLGHLCAAEIARQTKIPVRTVRRPRKITLEDNRAIGQWIRRNNEVTAQKIGKKLQSNFDLTVFRWVAQRQLHRLGYENVLPRGTSMLTNE
ncbi:unnamed protein product [Rotaria magnacalcarata]|uniref:Uncharacterized protein n=1 Tax=Rotaria magnacalcarata TaxID=392030 RepID=A0A8S2V3Y2_9BILA|nr:unnamed protein product [Rotaria magnacalcarata]CAF4373943.1 unnamed protein product [Rotaria magnacalcarata]